MAEESVAELYAEITADMDEFDHSIDRVYDRLDKLEEKDISVQAETKGVESSVSSLGMEMAALGGALATVFHYLHQTSGGLQAMTNMASGLIGAGIDTFLVEIMIPLWDALKDSISDTSEEADTGIGTWDRLANAFVVTDEGILKLKDDTVEGHERLNEFLGILNAGRLNVDEYGNAIYKVGDVLYYYDGATGAFVGTTQDLNTEIGGMSANLAIANDLIGDVSTEWGVLASDVTLYAEGGREALEALWAADPGTYPGAVYASKVADAYEEVRIRLGAMLVQMGINPMTGETITAADMWGSGVTANRTEKENLEILAAYLLSGGD